MANSSAHTWDRMAVAARTVVRPAQTAPYSSQKPNIYSTSPITPAWGTRCKRSPNRPRRAALRALLCHRRTVRLTARSSRHWLNRLRGRFGW